MKVKFESASLEFDIVGEGAFIKNLYVAHRQMGHGTGCMRKAIALGHKLGLNYIILIAKPYTAIPDNMNQKQLDRFYQGFGFERTNNQNPPMMRLELL